MPENNAKCNPAMRPPKFAVTHICTSRNRDAVGKADDDGGSTADCARMLEDEGREFRVRRDR